MMYDHKRSTLQECANVLALLMDVLVCPAILMAIWNNIFIQHVVVTDALPPISYGTAICVRLLMSVLFGSSVNSALAQDRDNRWMVQAQQMQQSMLDMRDALGLLGIQGATLLGTQSGTQGGSQGGTQSGSQSTLLGTLGGRGGLMRQQTWEPTPLPMSLHSSV